MLDAIKKLFGGKKGKKEESRGGAGAQHDDPTKLAISKADLSGSASASHGVSSHKARRHHRKHDAMESGSASRGVGGRESSTRAVYAGSAGAGLKFTPDRDTSIDFARSHHDVLPLAGAVGRSASDLSRNGFVDPDGNRLTDDDVEMMKLMLTQILESYSARINRAYNDSGIAGGKVLLKDSGFNKFLNKHPKSLRKLILQDNRAAYDEAVEKHPVSSVSQGDVDYFLGTKFKPSFVRQVKNAELDEKAKPILVSNVEKRLQNLSGKLDAIHQMPKPTSASDFLKEYMENILNDNLTDAEKLTLNYNTLKGEAGSKQGVADFTKTLNAASAAFEAHKDDELEGIGDIQEYNGADSQKMTAGRIQGSTTLMGKFQPLFQEYAEFRNAINQDKVLKAANNNKEIKEATDLTDVMMGNNDITQRVLGIVADLKLTGSLKDLGSFNNAAGIASAYAQTLKSKSTITFSDLMHTYMAINKGVGEKGELKAQSAGTGGKIQGPCGDTISADLLLLFTYVAKTMNEIKAIQKQNPNIAKSRAISLAGIVNTMTVSLHTFANGNGRTCRLLADVVLEAFGLPPASVNDTLTGVGGLVGEVYVNDEADPTKETDFDRSTRGYLEGVKESDRLLHA